MVSRNELPFWEYFQEVETVPWGRETVADTCVKLPGWGITWKGTVEDNSGPIPAT
jgi:hypothetical protein